MTRMTLAEAEPNLKAAGYDTEREQAGNIVFFLACRLPPNRMPTKLEAFMPAPGQPVDQHTVSAFSVKKLLNAATRRG